MVKGESWWKGGAEGAERGREGKGVDENQPVRVRVRARARGKGKGQREAGDRRLAMANKYSTYPTTRQISKPFLFLVFFSGLGFWEGEKGEGFLCADFQPFLRSQRTSLLCCTINVIPQIK